MRNRFAYLETSSNMLLEDLSMKRNPDTKPSFTDEQLFSLSFSGFVKRTFSSPGLFGGRLHGSTF